jgi:tetratricopeptide (TPR) repeat protein
VRLIVIGSMVRVKHGLSAAMGCSARSNQRHPDHADLQNILAFSYRNLQQCDRAFKHYRRALELDPRHCGVHEHIDETYLLTGDLPGASKHLAALKEICLLHCDELQVLEGAIAKCRGPNPLPQ